MIELTRAQQKRFWSHVLVDDGCWTWTAALDAYGYASTRVDGKAFKGHRVAYELLVGPIPPGLTLDHLCRNRACVNPTHLEPVTNWENVSRGNGPTAINARKTHCVRGHEYTDETTHIRSDGSRACLVCRKIRNDARSSNQTEAAA